MPKTCALCPTEIRDRQTFCEPCAYQRELDANNKRRLKKRAENPTVARCVECSVIVRRKGDRCPYHSRQHFLHYQSLWRRGLIEEPEPVIIPPGRIYVTPEMQRACPLRVELWRTIAPNTPHLDWRTL